MCIRDREIALEDYWSDVTGLNPSAKSSESCESKGEDKRMSWSDLNGCEAEKVVQNKEWYVLPLPNDFGSLRGFSHEEKIRIHSQFFRASESRLAELFVQTPVSFSSPLLSPAPFSAATSCPHHTASAFTRIAANFEGFSDFAASRKPQLTQNLPNYFNIN
eukprot:TRINITY_DN10667_c0_g3_i1.p1 TRINITY_DN10667_c0_g3~~TRINITY_DN10667_c0_g3_i1.p1  ORF type:complete len:161 (+),score=13.50 TRINITY_DN10667_c0_g3_i1:83-565(+)